MSFDSMWRHCHRDADEREERSVSVDVAAELRRHQIQNEQAKNRGDVCGWRVNKPEAFHADSHRNDEQREGDPTGLKADLEDGIVGYSPSVAGPLPISARA